jgi:hypothetical protein
MSGSGDIVFRRDCGSTLKSFSSFCGNYELGYCKDTKGFDYRKMYLANSASKYMGGSHGIIKSTLAAPTLLFKDSPLSHACIIGIMLQQTLSSIRL